MPKAADRIWVQGKELDQLTWQILSTADKLLALPKFGGEREPATIMQGSFRPRTKYSASTHMGGAVVDLSAFNWRNRVAVLDLLGLVLFHRTRAQGDWPEHTHGIVNGMGNADPSAQAQVTAAKAGKNGLVGNGVDPDKGLRSGLWPLAVYGGRTGILTATTNTRLYDGPASTRKPLCTIPKGTPVTALMEVRNSAGNKWFVTDQGCWGYSQKWETA
jgi:hypothetical protein